MCFCFVPKFAGSKLIIYLDIIRGKWNEFEQLFCLDQHAKYHPGLITCCLFVFLLTLLMLLAILVEIVNLRPNYHIITVQKSQSLDLPYMFRWTDHGSHPDQITCADEVTHMLQNHCELWADFSTVAWNDLGRHPNTQEKKETAAVSWL